jgi:hypothetical protein
MKSVVKNMQSGLEINIVVFLFVLESHFYYHHPPSLLFIEVNVIV